ncbi:MAG: hypothetical protein J0H68_05550 [Sphingobacteriia bacterium]|nr:hypothetical protein [Sphingobacteriia bacterium]
MYKILMLVAILALSGCIEKKMRDLETPCVANEFNEKEDLNNPCIRIPVNAKWLFG